MARQNDVRPTYCDHDRLERLLDGRLQAGEQADAETHLESCPTCRAAFYGAAADAGFCADALTFLQDDAFDAEAAEYGLSGDSAAEPVFDQPEVHCIERYLDPSDDPQRLGRFGGYEVVEVAGGGGMGVVLKGYEGALDRFVAIKVLAPHLAASGAARARFAREAKAAAAVLHENVVAIHRVAEANGLPYLVMPFVAGESLQKRLDEQGPLELLETLRIGMQVAAGLAAAHAQGLVHRDVKPGNVLLDKGVERVVLTDFGLARAADDASLTRSGVIAGTPQYMSPEQARGEPVDHRSDLFSLGSLLYAMLAGRPPFRAETTFGVLRKISDCEPRLLRELAPQSSDWLCAIVTQLMAKRPADRLGSAAEVADLLGAWIAHLQRPDAVPSPPQGTDRREGPPARRLDRRAAAAAIAAAVLGLAILSAFRPDHGSTRVSVYGTPVAAVRSMVASKPHGAPAIYIADARGGNPARLVRFGEYTSQGSADWSGDGSRIAFDAYRPALGENQSNAHVITVSADGRDPLDLGPGALPSWSPDAAQIAFSTYQPRGVWVMNADGTDRRLLDGTGWSGRWSPDGRTIAYTVQRGGRGDICLHEVATDLKQYVFGNGGSPYETIYWSFCWSPDSKLLCFLGVRPGGAREVATVSADGSQAHHRVHRRGPASAAFAWHPDGRRILMAAEPPAAGVKRLLTFAIDGTDDPDPLPAMPEDFAAAPGDWSPDGSRVAFTGFPNGHSD